MGNVIIYVIIGLLVLFFLCSQFLFNTKPKNLNSLILPKDKNKYKKKLLVDLSLCKIVEYRPLMKKADVSVFMPLQSLKRIMDEQNSLQSDHVHVIFKTKTNTYVYGPVFRSASYVTLSLAEKVAFSSLCK